MLDALLEAFGSGDHLTRKQVMALFGDDEAFAADMVTLLVTEGLVSEVGLREEHALPKKLVRQEVSDWDKVLISTTPNCIVFYRRTAFLVIRPMKKWLDIKFYSEVAHKDKPVLKSVAVGNKFENHIRLAVLDELKPGVFIYLREAYERA